MKEIAIRVNGEPVTQAPCSVDALVKKLGYEPRFVAVAINYECIRRSDFLERAIQEGDDIEILSPQSGG